MKRLLPLALVLLATQSQALSCLRPDPVLAFQAAQAAPETYVVLRGTFSLAEIYKPPPVVDGEPYAVPVWFSGQVLGRDGFVTPLETPLTVQVTCAGPWCGGPPGPEPLIAFARYVDGVYLVTSDPCGGAMFEADALTADLLTSCMRGGACVPQDMPD